VSTKYSPSQAILELGDKFYDVVKPADFPKAILRYRNLAAAESVGLGQLGDDKWREHFHAFKPLPEGLPDCLALRYHGHQFQSYNDRIGDGRGFLFAQLGDDRGRLLDLATKGSGQTPWSRAGDGRLTLKGAMREALATEMLESLGVNTSKTFCFFETGEALERGDEPSPTRSAVLTRLGHSHIRFGSFQRQVALGDRESTQALVDYCIRHFYPNAHDAGDLLQSVVVKTARLCASWMAAGFVHGVLNTDNMNINGESFDYGPYRFLPAYDPDFTAAYFDESGLYAYGRQPEAVIWNLEQLATCLLYVHEDRDSLIEAMRMFVPTFNDSAGEFIRERLGLVERSPHVVVDSATEDDLLLAVFNFLAASQVTFEQFFFDWYGGNDSRERAMRSPEAEKYKGPEFDKFMIVLSEWPAAPDAKARLSDKYFERKRPCMMLIDEIESIWESIARNDDWAKFEAKIEDVRAMGRLYGRR
jgi:uncharacterized protein YdiU (UPF0061 family)